MRRLIDFLFNMETRRWRTLAVGAVLILAVVAVYLLGRSQLGLEAEERLEAWLSGYAGSPLAFAATVALFVAAAFVGAPQFVLIAACVVVFGPSLGFFYSWGATVISAGVTWGLGRVLGLGPIERMQSRTVARLTAFIGRNAFFASFIIRNVPSAPFIVVNMVFGAMRAPFLAFIAGCALGVLPKTALVAFFGGAVMVAATGDGTHTTLILAAIAVVWLGVMLAVRELIRRRNPAVSRLRD